MIACLACLLSFSSCAKHKINNSTISGPWLMTFSTSGTGDLQVLMHFDVSTQNADTIIEAYTKKNTDRLILGFWKSELARCFGHFKHGSLLRITKGRITNADSLKGVLVTPFGNFYIETKVTNGSMTGVLKDGKRNIQGYVSAKQGLPNLPIRDYNMILNKAIAVTGNKLYDPSLLKSEEWNSFIQKMRKVCNVTQDDAAFIIAFFYYEKKLPFTHFALYRKADEKSADAEGNEKYVQLEEKTPQTIYMKISSFSGSASEMDSAFIYVCKKGYTHLIVDLRDNPGGSVEAGMAFARHLVQDTIYGGVFLTQKYFAAHTDLPPVSAYNSFLHFTEANYDLLEKGISEYPAICLQAIPQTPVFKGKIDILINKNTASTCEPIIYTLKQHHLARLVGERSAGAMLNGEFFDVADGYRLFLPTATYYTSDGFKIDKHGVTPNVEVKKGDALKYVLDEGVVK